MLDKLFTLLKPGPLILIGLLALSFYCLIKAARQPAKGKSIAIRAVLFAIIGLITAVYLRLFISFETIAWIQPQQFIRETSYKNSPYTVSFYLQNGGATTSYAVLGRVKDKHSNWEKNIFWQNKAKEVTSVWLDEHTLVINGHKLDVTKDVYDYRND
ncbi:MAG: DUF5412 family protein [Gallicola sp.]|nr:DUF5412 family protein [Gallicola sp.]